MKPLVSIIIPTHNRAHLIGETLESILSQTYENWECIIVDDGSTDNTFDKMNKITGRDKRFLLYSRPNERSPGASSCRNQGLDNAKGELIQFLDSDDLLSENKLEAQVDSYLQNKGLTLLTCKWGGFREKDDLKTRFKYKYHSYRDCVNGIDLLNTFGSYNEYFPLHVYLTSRKLIDKAGYWNENITNNDDAEFFTRVILNANKLIYVPEAAVYYRYSGKDKLSTLNSKERAQSLINSVILIEEYMRDFVVPQKNKYVLNAKRFTYKEALKKFPDIIAENYSFFKSIYPFYKRLLKKFE